MERIGSVLPMELRLAAFCGQGLDRPPGRLLDLLFGLLVVRAPYDETVSRRTDILDLHRDAVRLRRGLRQGLLDVDRPVRAEVRRLDVPVDRDVGRDDVFAGDLDERLHPRTFEPLALEGALIHHALLERAIQRPERIEEAVPELLPALVDRLPEALGHDPEQVLRLLLVLPLLDLLAALVLVDRLEREVDVALVRAHLRRAIRSHAPRRSSRPPLLQDPQDLASDRGFAARRLGDRGAADRAENHARGAIEDDLLVDAIRALDPEELARGLRDHLCTSMSSNFFARIPGR